MGLSTPSEMKAAYDAAISRALKLTHQLGNDLSIASAYQNPEWPNVGDIKFLISMLEDALKAIKREAWYDPPSKL